MTTKYEELANILMDELEIKELHSNILVGSTLNVKWEDVVTPDFICWGVLNPSGGNNVELNAGAMVTTENVTLAIALPNNTKDEFNQALDSFMDAIQDLVKTTHEINGSYYVLVNNGSSSTEFMTIRGGNQIGIMMLNLSLIGGDGLLNAKDVTISIQAKSQVGQANSTHTFKGFYNYIFQKQKQFDSMVLKSNTTQQNYVNSIQRTLTIDYYKLHNDTLHQLLESDTETFVITLNDGETNLLNGVEMHLSSLTQNGIIGNYINMRVSFVDGVA